MTGRSEHQDVQQGKFGKEKHFRLVKKSLLYLIDRYWDKFGVIRVENATISVSADISSDITSFHSMRGYEGEYTGAYTLHPDISLTLAGTRDDSPKKLIIVECETSPAGMLKDRTRMTAYHLIRLKQEDRTRLHMYLAMPKEFKGKVKKPEDFNDLWFFDMGAR